MQRFPRKRVALPLLAVSVLTAAGAWWSMEPLHHRTWQPQQAVLPEVEFRGDQVQIRNIRNFTWHSDTDFTPAYYDEVYDLTKLERVWFVLSPFNPDWRGPAHSFVTFDFSDGKHLSVSVEARREVGEEYSVWKGLLRRYELMYVIGSESDLIGLRSVTWDDPTYLYPTTATSDKARALLEQLLRRSEAIRREPAFYNTVTRSCNTELRDAANAIADRPIPYGIGVLLPGYSDALAYRQGLIATELDLEQARKKYRINERARAAAGEADFSRRIRVP